MNKKFSTLLCASLLFSSAFSAVNAVNLTNAAVGANATAVAKLDKAALSGVYQLRVGTQVLVIEDGKYVLKNVNDGFDLQASLWCVQVTEEGQGKEPIYDFVNKATGEFLAISEEDVVGLQVGGTTDAELSVGETFGGWAFSPEYKENLKENMPLYTYQEADNVLLLVKGDKGGIKAKKVKASEARSNSTGGAQFTLYDAGTYVLSAAEINAYLKDNKNVLTFTPDANADVNPFSTTAFVAKGVAADTDHNFVYVTSKSDANAYLKVDTAANGVGIQFLKFGWTDMAKEKDFDNSLLVNQHKFLFTYRPSLDQLRIQVKQARYKSDKNAEKYWSEIDGTSKGKIYNYGDKFVDPFKTEGNAVAAKLHVKLQNFTVADRIATIGEQPINTKIGFGLKGCFVTSDKTSVDNGLYIIKNAKGQVLAAPIHKNAEGGNKQYAIEWVTLDEQEPLHMPAYQWVITKTLNAEVSQPVSPVKIVNREFPNAKDWDNVQFRLNEDGEIYTLTTGADMLNNVTFVQIKDSAIIKDKKLGYKHIDSNDLLVNRYKFNYLNPFSMEYWIANGTGKDSLIYVKQDAGDYALVEGSTYEYGIDVDAALLKKIPGLAQLERTNYVIAKDEQDRLVEAYGSKYSMGVANYGSNMVVDTFFFKENNHYDGKDFYAIVESNYNRTAHATEIQNTGVTKKVGIADDGMSAGLKVQLLNETRTSAFTVEPSTTPLYRRFNNVALSESATDGRDSLRFFETIRKEYLMDENNSNLTDANVDYLGMWTADKATGLSFQIDTAWVNRGAGYIKPQYLISVAHNDFAGTPGKPCTEDGPHVDKDGNITDAEHCVHATPAIPGFERAKYLVSFQDSVDVYGQDKPYADIKGGYTRVGFVEGIRVADTLWILPAEFVALANDKISFDALEAYNDSVKNLASKSYLIKNRLDGDDHKNYTWSFRYVHPENAGNVTEEGVENQFLFESNNYDNKIIAPENAAWLKIQNGCVVLTDKSSTFSHAATGGDGALIFNVENKVDDQLATDNEEIATSEVTVIALQGAVRVANAEGKKVVITNILGQTVTNTVITSSDATIAAPQGVVVVAVEGEEAVKAIVK